MNYFVSAFLLSKKCFWDSSMLLHVLAVCSFLLHILWICHLFFILLFLNILVVSSFQPLRVKLPWALIYKSLSIHFITVFYFLPLFFNFSVLSLFFVLYSILFLLSFGFNLIFCIILFFSPFLEYQLYFLRVSITLLFKML